MTTPEFSREIDVRQVQGKQVRLVANPAECDALARRFGVVRIESLAAELGLVRLDDAVEARGQLDAALVQACSVSGEDFPVTISEPLFFRFVPASSDHRADEEIELAADDCDEIDYSGTMIDLGEAVAQSLALAIDPFAEGPGADEARRQAGIIGEGEAGPFAALAALKK
mgnify:CR=1 FL=1